MIWKSYSQLAVDMHAWAVTLREQIPDLQGVVGIPRGGLIPAAILSQRLNTPLYTLEALQGGYKVPEKGPILVVDDTTWSGFTIAQVKQTLSKFEYLNIKYGAYLAGHEGIARVDYFYLATGMHPQLLEWDLWSVPFTSAILSDLDGVLAEDWTLPGEEGPYRDRYRNHLDNAKCLVVPAKPLLAVVTSRLRKYRAETEAWLARHGISYKYLMMAPYDTEIDRMRGHGFSQYKAEVYSSWPEAQLFVESDRGQATSIHVLTGKPVLHYDHNTSTLWTRQ